MQLIYEKSVPGRRGVRLPATDVPPAAALPENLLRKEARNPWFEALGFGLLHGLGFAGFLADALAGEPLVLTALFAFNVGVELGQLAVVVGCALVGSLVFLRWRRSRTTDAPPALAPRSVRLATSAVVALFGFYWFVERAGWIP